MSWETWWELPWESPDEDAIRAAADVVVAASAGLLQVVVIPDADEADDDSVTCFFSFRVSDASALVEALDPGLDSVVTDYRGDLDPPEEGDHYRVALILTPWDEGEAARMQLGTADADNRACWPIAWLLGVRLAAALGATHEDDIIKDPGVAMNWNSAAILRPKS
ncbi:MAG: hypothetical protein IT370_25410 [Deltaproteobacteria bacterium]|nr:hypothetical protein [Deltaproteobacteria bacterium]